MQSIANGLILKLLNPLEGEEVLDLCSAPGGKSLLISENIKGSDSLLVSLDRPGPRMGRLRENLGRVNLNGKHHSVDSSEILTKN